MSVSQRLLLALPHGSMVADSAAACFNVRFSQVDPSKYKDISTSFGIMLQEQGLGGFFRGWMATLVGYSCQGACKFGFYEFFKKRYSDIAGPDNAEKLRTLIYLAASASAEVIADFALCPMEAVKVRVQTQPGFARCLTDGLPKLVQSEGAFGYRYCMSCSVCSYFN
jgi:solute carrier family 25 (mitochondrial phosphate transporter), member 3